MSDQAQSFNPFQTPQADLNAPLELSGDAAVAEQIRREHIGHEVSIKSSALLYGLGGIVGLVAGIAILVHLAAQSGERFRFSLTIASVAIGLAVLQFVAAIGLRRLRRWARIVATIATIPGLFQFPFGSLIGGYFLYLFWSKKGNMIFSDEYPPIVALTPHVRYRTSIWVWILLGVLLLFLAMGIVASMLTTRPAHRAALLPTTELRQSLV